MRRWRCSWLCSLIDGPEHRGAVGDEERSDSRPLDTPWFTVCQILITPRLREKKAAESLQRELRRRNKWILQRGEEGKDGEKEMHGMSHPSCCVGRWPVACFNHNDKSRCESCCSSLLVGPGSSFPDLSVAPPHLFTSFLWFYCSYLWEMK